MYSREKQFRQEDQKPKKSHRNTPSFSSSLLDEICRSIDEKPPKPPPETARFSRASLVDKWMENDKSVFRRRPKCENAVFPDTTTSSSTSSNSSSADTELLSNRPKPVRTRHSDSSSSLFHDHHRNRAAAAAAGGNDDLIKSKSRALRLYSNLKKMKQPISPGARLTSFINSIFSGLNRKKPKQFKETVDRVDHKAAAPCVVGDGRPPLPPNAYRSWREGDVGKLRCGRDEDGEDEDVCSESSSDLFELDHLSLFGSRDRFCEELPVYETTYFDKNCRLIR